MSDNEPSRFLYPYNGLKINDMYAKVGSKNRTSVQRFKRKIENMAAHILPQKTDMPKSMPFWSAYFSQVFLLGCLVVCIYTACE